MNPFSEKVLSNRALMLVLILGNFVGFLFGIYYYTPQLSATSPFLWLLVIDCPLYVLLFSVILGGELMGKKLPSILKYLTAVGLIKYGLWTIAVVLLHFGYFFSHAPLIYAIILPTHLIMAAESLLLLRMFRPTLRSSIFVAAFFLANDLSDYVFPRTLPWIPEAYVPQLFVGSVLASVLIPAAIYYFGNRRNLNP